MKKIKLKEHFERILEEKDKALAAALVAVKEEGRKTEIAAEKRFDLLNELRAGVATKDEVKALEKVVDDLRERGDIGKGKSMGINAMIGWIIGGATIIGVLFNILLKYLETKK